MYNMKYKLILIWSWGNWVVLKTDVDAMWFLPSALNVKVKRFVQARVNGGSNYDSLSFHLKCLIATFDLPVGLVLWRAAVLERACLPLAFTWWESTSLGKPLDGGHEDRWSENICARLHLGVGCRWIRAFRSALAPRPSMSWFSSWNSDEGRGSLARGELGPLTSSVGKVNSDCLSGEETSQVTCLEVVRTLPSTVWILLALSSSQLCLWSRWNSLGGTILPFVLSLGIFPQEFLPTCGVAESREGGGGRTGDVDFSLHRG